MGQRITRAKAKIEAARIPYRCPPPSTCPHASPTCSPSSSSSSSTRASSDRRDTDPVRRELTAEAIRLTRLLRALLPEDGEVAGLLALMPLPRAALERRSVPWRQA
jgi:RNA polymerase sigma-70 factor (ECF subfamily)